MSINSAYTTSSDWAEYYKRNFQPRDADKVTFSDLFSQYLSPAPAKSVLEIGCAGGLYLAHFAKKYGYQPHGIDYSDSIETVNLTFSHNGLQPPKLYKEDFFTWNPQRQFDVVCSVGFVEHFGNFSEVVAKHTALVAPGGTLIITMPNFAGVQRWFHWLIDRENLKIHNTSVMSPEKLRTALASTSFDIKYLDYYKTFGFWIERDRNKFAPWEKAAFWTIRKFGKLLQVVVGYDRPNRLFSPHIVCIAKRKS